MWNIGTAIYEMANYLTFLLTPLSNFENTIVNTADFIKRIQKNATPDGCKIV